MKNEREILENGVVSPLALIRWERRCQCQKSKYRCLENSGRIQKAAGSKHCYRPAEQRRRQSPGCSDPYRTFYERRPRGSGTGKKRFGS